MSNWIDVNDRLPSEDESVLVLQKGNDVCGQLVLQASIFEGQFYADHMDGLIDYDDSLTVNLWQPLPPLPLQGK